MGFTPCPPPQNSWKYKQINLVGPVYINHQLQIAHFNIMFNTEVLELQQARSGPAWSMHEAVEE